MGRIIRNILFIVNILLVVGLALTGYSYLLSPTTLPCLAAWGLFFPLFLAANGAFLVVWLFIKPVRALLPFAALIVCYTPVRMYMGLAPTGNVPPQAIKVMTYNVLDFKSIDGALHRDDNPVVPFLLKSEADIICLQECAEKNLAAASYDALNKVYPYHHYSDQGKGMTSLAVYSKYKIAKVDSIPCDTCANISVAYTIILPRGYVMVVNNHFESNKFTPEKKKDFRSMMLGTLEKDSAKKESRYIYRQFTACAQRRTPQVRAVAAFLKQYKDVPIILCGDFNDIPISYNYHTLARHLTDCFCAAGFGCGWTYCHNGMRVRIDNIMCSSDIEPYRCKVLSDITYSDHYPVVAWLNLRPHEDNSAPDSAP